MTDRAYEPDLARTATATDAYRRRIAKRYAAERRFKWMGIAAVGAAVGFLVVLLSTVITQALPAFTVHRAALSLDLTQIDPAEPARGNYDGIIRDALTEAFPFAEGRTESRAVRSLMSTGAPFLLQNAVVDGDVLPGQTQRVELLVDDVVDLYLKGLVAGDDRLVQGAAIAPDPLVLSDVRGDVTMQLPAGVGAAVAELVEDATGTTLDATDLRLTSGMPSILLYGGGGHHQADRHRRRDGDGHRLRAAGLGYAGRLVRAPHRSARSLA